MSQDNQITVRGYVTAEPKFWKLESSQTPVAEIRVGSTPRRLNRATGEWLDGDTSYYTVKCWRRLAVNVASCLRKGDMVIIRGKVVMRTWLDDQQRSRTQVQVEADSVGHDLSFGWSHFIRGVQTPPNAAQNLADGELARHDGPDGPEGAGGPSGGELGGGRYDDYLPASLPGDDGRDDGPDGPDGHDDPDYQGAPAAAGDIIAGMVRDLSASAEVAPAL